MKRKLKTIKAKNILLRKRSNFHKPTKMEKDKRHGRGKERQQIKSEIKKIES